MAVSAERKAITRRGLLRTAALGTVAGASSSAMAIPFTRIHMSSDDLLDGAIEIASFIRNGSVKTSHGRTWLVEPSHPGRSTTPAETMNLYSGSAGIILYFLHMAKVTGDETYLDDAIEGADHLASTWEETKFIDRSLYTGLAGAGFSLSQAWQITGESRYRTAAIDIASLLADDIDRGDQEANSSVDGAISGDSGTILFLLDAGRALKEEGLSQSAQATGYRLLSDHLHGRSGLYLGFYRGTPGIVYTAARLHQLTNKSDFLTIATNAAHQIEEVASIQQNQARIPYQVTAENRSYYSGYCKGSAGTARTFALLHRVTGQAEYLDLARKLCNGTNDTYGAMSSATDGNALCQWSGRAGIVDFFVGMSDLDNRAFYLDRADAVAGRMLDGWRANIRGEQRFSFWSRVPAPTSVMLSGFSLGAAGMGSALLNLYAAHRNLPHRLGLPDNPFFSGRVS